MRDALSLLWGDEMGADATEYALIAALVALAVFGGIGTLGAVIKRIISQVADTIPDVAGT